MRCCVGFGPGLVQGDQEGRGGHQRQRPEDFAPPQDDAAEQGSGQEREASEEASPRARAKGGSRDCGIGNRERPEVVGVIHLS